MDLISIIVPVYNVENYLKECIESLINQSYSNTEILLIDDGSTDNSGIICDEYQKVDSRITVYHKKNGGLSDARNYGIERMNGNYVTFVDSDDFISIYTLEIMYEVAINHNSDLVFTKNAVRFNDGDRVIVANNNNIEGITKLFSQDDILEYSFYQKSNVTGAPGKLFSKKIFEDGLRFPYGVYFEDLATTYKFIMRANRIVMIDTPLYAYRMRNDSIIHQKFSTKKLTCIEVTQNLYNDIIQKRPQLKKAAASRCCSCNRMVYSQISYKDKKNRNLIWNEILKYRKIVILDNKARKRERISCGISYLGQNAFYAFNYIIIYLKYKILKR